jgi:hypothetical protein
MDKKIRDLIDDIQGNDVAFVEIVLLSKEVLYGRG